MTESPLSANQLPSEVIDIESDPESDQTEKKTELPSSADDYIEPEPPGPKNKRSKAWKNFNWDPSKKQWQCLHCSRTYKQCSSSTLNNHVRRSHPNQSQQPSVKTHLIKLDQEDPVRSANPPLTKEGIKLKLLKLIVCSDQPFAFAEDGFFRDFVQYVSRNDKNAELPCRQTIKTWITEAFLEKKQNLKEISAQNSSKVSFTIDGWTSSNQFSFQAVISSWIDDNWSLQHAVLDVTMIEGSHTGENLAFYFEKVLDEYELWEKFLALTSDNAGNMNTMASILETTAKEKYQQSTFSSNDYRIRCMAHIINLACKVMIKCVDHGSSHAPNDCERDDETGGNVILKVRQSVVKIRGSPQRRAFFAEQCKIFKLDPKNLVRDVDTRWNSTLDMLERAYELRKPLEMALTAYGFDASKLSDDEWKQIELLIEILKPFRDATFLLSSQEPVLSSTVQVYEILFEHLEVYLPKGTTKTSYRVRTHENNESYPPWLVEAAEAGWSKLQEYYPTADGLAYSVSTILDPRFKDKWYTAVGWNQSWINQAKRAVRCLWESNYKKEIFHETEEQAPKRPKLNPILDRISEQMKNLQQKTTADELTTYYKESTVTQQLLDCQDPLSKGVLGWWKVHQNVYPALAKMARDFLAISGTGVPVERLFSTASDILSNRRQALSPQSIRECMCLKNWMKHEGLIMHQNDINEAIKYKVLGDTEIVGANYKPIHLNRSDSKIRNLSEIMNVYRALQVLNTEYNSVAYRMTVGVQQAGFWSHLGTNYGTLRLFNSMKFYIWINFPLVSTSGLAVLHQLFKLFAWVNVEALDCLAVMKREVCNVPKSGRFNKRYANKLLCSLRPLKIKGYHIFYYKRSTPVTFQRTLTDYTINVLLTF